MFINYDEVVRYKCKYTLNIWVVRYDWYDNIVSIRTSKF